MTDRPVLEITNLTVKLPKGADREHAIEDISISVRRREIVCLVGESGSGKSVSAFSVMGLLPGRDMAPIAGSIKLEGEELIGADEARMRDLRGARMSMIFQEPMTALNPTMTCSQQIEEVLTTHTDFDADERQKRILNILEQVQLPDPPRMAASYPHQLSGGQRQRIMIAMALVLEPALLIADEPTTALDVTTQAQILKLIKEIQASHDTAVLFITHDFGVVADIADRVAVMQWGKVVEEGTADDVLRRPTHPYTKMLIGSVPSFTPRVRPRQIDAPVVLSTDNLSKTYSGGGFFQKARPVRAANAVTVEIRRGETLGIVGESGSGKSTVARCIARLINPSDGHVYLDGDDIAKASPFQLRNLRRRVQIVFQDPYRSLNPRRTVGASIIEGPMNYGTSQRDAMKRAQELMSLVRLDPGSLDRYPHQFSGGQRQRICIARALAMGPDLLIADEAVSALDVSVQAQVLDLLDDIRQRLDLAMLFITHDLRVAAQVCDTVAVMHRGEVVEYGTAAEVFGDPQHDYTRSLFAAAPGRGFAFGGAAA
ncbi:oligopeptide ABC transporter, ATP-binding protein [alpha proteobacterium BAL199]|jgi:peptide/nickel transport system ATP-binding protein|nr:oligopeptide ABC transporter, ATP-binding protein [alpha proteobacterium BAL199]